MTTETTGSIPDCAVTAAVLRAHADDITSALTLWAGRNGNEGTPEQRQAANAAMDAISALERELSAIRSRLVREMRAYDDETGRRVDALLATLEAGRSDPPG